MTTTTTPRVRTWILYVLVAVATLALLTLPVGCHKHTNNFVGEQGAPGEDGQDGTDEEDALDFSYVRDIDNSTLTGDYWVGDATLVIPQRILEAAPGTFMGSGLILYVGYEGSPIRFYLVDASGIYDVRFHKKQHKELLGRAVIAGRFMVLVELSVLDGPSGLLSLIEDAGVVVESELEFISLRNKTEVRIGDVRIRRSRN